MGIVDKLYEDYKSHLQKESPKHLEKLIRLENGNIAGARAEAVTYYFLRSFRCQVENFDHPSKGGPDFKCRKQSFEFLVEVTSLNSESVVEHSGVVNEIPDKIYASACKKINNLIFRKAINKTKQLSKYSEFPRILVITTEHVHGSILFDSTTSELLLTGNYKIQVEVGKTITHTRNITDLDTAVFFRKNTKTGKIESCRRSISAILLIQIYDNECCTLGILNPDPKVVFHYQLLPNIPFLRVNPWPIIDNKIFTEWVIEHPQPNNFVFPFM